MKSNVALQEKLAKQNEISRQKLVQELAKLEKVEKSDLRMIETARHRFRSRHRNLEDQRESSGSNAVNVRMYETHNPGFCYHCTGAIKQSGPPTPKQTQKDSYDFVRSILFTNGEVDIDKVLCLHLLTAHSTKWNNNEDFAVRPVTPLMEKAKAKHFTGAWNNILPCYVVDTQLAASDTHLQNVKLHEDPRKLSLEEEAVREFEEKYRQYLADNVEFGRTMSTTAKQTAIGPRGFGKMPIISPHVYSLLGASHELRVKRALVEGTARRKFARSSMDLSVLDETSLSFDLDDDDDVLSRTTTNVSTRNWGTKSVRSPSRRSGIGSSFKLDHGITMLRSKHGKPYDHLSYRLKNYEGVGKDLVTIKPSFRTIREAGSKTSSTKSQFRNIHGSRPSTNSVLSGSSSPAQLIKKCRKCIYFNSPIKSVSLRSKDYKTVPIVVNYQIQALVHSVLEVLERVSPEKLKKIIETARDTEKINKILLRPEMQNFVQSLLGQSLVSSMESFVISAATVANEIDFRFEGILEKEIIALTLELPPVPSLDALIAEIRNNIFLDIKKGGTCNLTAKGMACAEEQKVGKDEAINDSFNETHTDGKLNTHLNLYDGKLSCANAVVNINECCEKNKIKNTQQEVAVSLSRDKLPKKLIANKKQESEKPTHEDTLGHIMGTKSINNTNAMPVSSALDKPGSGKNQNANQNTKKLSNKNESARMAETKSAKNWKKRGSRNHESIEKQQKHSGNNLVKHSSNAKSWKAAQDPGYLDADHVILRRMTNSQRILVGQMCASFKTKRINNEGLLNERVPLAALITPALSRESIKFLTKGTIYSKSETIEEHNEDVEDNVFVPDKLTGPVLAKIRQDVAENETKRRLKHFLQHKI